MAAKSCPRGGRRRLLLLRPAQQRRSLRHVRARTDITPLLHPRTPPTTRVCFPSPTLTTFCNPCALCTFCTFCTPAHTRTTPVHPVDPLAPLEFPCYQVRACRPHLVRDHRTLGPWTAGGVLRRVGRGRGQGRSGAAAAAAAAVATTARGGRRRAGTRAGVRGVVASAWRPGPAGWCCVFKGQREGRRALLTEDRVL